MECDLLDDGVHRWFLQRDVVEAIKAEISINKFASTCVSWLSIHPTAHLYVSASPHLTICIFSCILHVPHEQSILHMPPHLYEYSQSHTSRFGDNILCTADGSQVVRNGQFNNPSSFQDIWQPVLTGSQNAAAISWQYDGTCELPHNISSKDDAFFILGVCSFGCMVVHVGGSCWL